MSKYLSPQSIQFLRELKKNNTVLKGRNWYQANKDRYQDLIKDPLLHICNEVGKNLFKDVPNLHVQPSRNVYRLHRDLRFTNDHRPFKEWIAFHLWLGKPSDKKDRPGFYFHLEPKEFFLGAGKWHFTPDQLKTFRACLLNDYQTKTLKSVLKKTTITNTLLDPHLKTIPKKYRSESLYPEGALYKGLCIYQSHHKVPKLVYSHKIVDHVVKSFKTMIPLVQWLDKNVCNPMEM